VHEVKEFESCQGIWEQLGKMSHALTLTYWCCCYQSACLVNKYWLSFASAFGAIRQSQINASSSAECTLQKIIVSKFGWW